jgi:hypothetical protein
MANEERPIFNGISIPLGEHGWVDLGECTDIDTVKMEVVRLWGTLRDRDDRADKYYRLLELHAGKREG